MDKCKKCKEEINDRQSYFGLCGDCCTIVFDCGCEAEIELKGKDKGYWFISNLCEAHDPTWVEDKEESYANSR